MKFSKKILRRDPGHEKVDQRKSIEQLEHDVWEDDDLKTSLIEKCYRYRKIPIQDLTSEQLRMLIGQNLGLNFILPLAFAMLEKNVLTSGDFYKGDLLQNILGVPASYWRKHPVFYKHLLKIIENGKNDIDSYDYEPVKNLLQEKITTFMNLSAEPVNTASLPFIKKTT